LFQQLKITNLYPESQNLVREVSDFLTEWNNDKPFIWANTSGSTGIPKKVKLWKSKMVASARMTGSFFGLKKGQNALLVLSPNYIAGKMMIVRALIHEMDLVLGRISSVPFNELDLKIHFTAMIPTQVKELMANDVSFDNIQHLIIGGAPIGNDLKKEISTLSTRCFATFGMTETLSHIALAEINENDLVFETLPGISIGLNSKKCLTISAPSLLDSDIETNDVVELIGHNKFIWKGRSDFVINSGGVKLHPELIEKRLASFIEQPFFISSESDAKFGDVVVLFIESDEPLELDLVFEALNKFEAPKKVYYKKSFVYTETGKINRIGSVE
jgi:O-succinylbenzoic acid--CoA ligase